MDARRPSCPHQSSLPRANSPDGGLTWIVEPPGERGLHDPGTGSPVQLPADLSGRVRLGVDVEVVVLWVLRDVLRQCIGHRYTAERPAVDRSVQRDDDRAVHTLGTLVDV